ncbi:lipid A deacylase LpxR family protein [Undibacterium sp. TJN19]|uniref:lipid A deacylase LpxR family protein n=1 Tax=Undibacterium sp. TJN19 TaxID=3413055 RepID=UPI003BF383BF
MNSSLTIPKISFLLVALCMTGLALAGEATSDLPSWQEFQQVKAAGKTIWQVDIDNDSLLFRKEDGFYTSGNWLGQSFVQTGVLQSVTYGWRIGQDLYTASDIKLLPGQISSHDHPYAGWLYGGIFSEKTEANGKSLRLGLDAGCLGPCAGGEWTQTHLHRLLRQPLPQGWGTQLRNEWGVQLTAESSPGRLLPMANVDMTPRFKAHFGNIFTDASAEMQVRAGALNTFSEQAANYGFLRGEIKAVGYNATIQGGYFNKQVTTVTPKTWVGELELGYLWRNDAYGLSVSIIRRSNEIKELSNGSGAQNFARVQLFYAM